MTRAPVPDVPWRHTAFYRFVRIAAPEALAQRLRRQAAALTGTVLVAPEGLNGALAGPCDAVQAFEDQLRQDPAFATLAFRHSGTGATAPYARLKVHVKPELVALGLAGVSGLGDATPQADPQRLDPLAWQRLLQDPRLVLIDNRNHFEHRLGRFDGAIDPGVGRFRDFAGWLQRELPAWRRDERPVAMYCTGGIRCEKLGHWLLAQDLPVHQLDGGILHYCATLPEAAPAGQRDWQGACFVFDNRIALDRHLQPTGASAAQVYDPRRADEAWRLARAQRLADAA